MNTLRPFLSVLTVGLVGLLAACGQQPSPTRFLEMTR